MSHPGNITENSILAEWQMVKILIRLLLRSSLIRIYTVCSGKSVKIILNISGSYLSLNLGYTLFPMSGRKMLSELSGRRRSDDLTVYSMDYDLL